MLQVSMRPRSVPPAAFGNALAAQAPEAATGAGASAATAAAKSAPGSAITGGWGGGSSQAAAAGPALGVREDDAVERLLLPLDSILSWAIAVMAGLFAVQTLGINIQPLLAVGGASSLIIGLATQTLLTNAVMGVSIFLSRPFVPGDSVTCQAAGAILVSGVVEKVTPMRTLLRTDDDVFVTLPNKTIADMIVFNKSRREARSRLVARSWERPYLKFKVKLPNKELHQLEGLQRDLAKALKRPGVQQQSVEVVLSKFTDAGAELLLTCLLLVAAASPDAQRLLLDLAFVVRNRGGTLVSIL